ncbi:hypothetical protein BKP35_15000 [Anaerobacillus arseniciselenatis]|uniref:tRNA(Met) cytidine acetate ligase n=1 Tax=Anaerobacillus arseniciselenatis TaxID=85682 RepID=A0A1S2LBK7_9BACI|nr:nucleotidyltransferase [Anaerobacillus arseniciselenatis]OIJ09791.1 hypothetical protein BKP35_15000 [Anaerobacillus arseniciselenatis]
MNVTGIVVEYNPFHNGHALHARQSKIKTNADIIVAVMSGNFLQRGEPALISKWARTKMALAAGVDIVVELPYVFATQHAEVFAQGAISILKEIGANAVCFGSESGEISDFTSLSTFIKEHEKTYSTFIKEALKEGYSYPKASALAFKKLDQQHEVIDLSLPNNILGYHYVKAISEQGAQITPFTIKRTNAQYHDQEIPEHSIASATSIRETLIKKNKQLTAIEHVVPKTTYNELKNYTNMYDGFQNWEQLYPFLKYKVLTADLSQLQSIYEAEEGLENRLKNIITNTISFQQLMEQLKTKRYTWTRLQRFCLHTLTNTTKEDMSIRENTCPYIRILGMTNNGRNYMSTQKKKLGVPLISTISKLDHPFIYIESRATSCYSLGYPSSVQKKLIKEEYAHPPIIV